MLENILEEMLEDTLEELLSVLLELPGPVLLDNMTGSTPAVLPRTLLDVESLGAIVDTILVALLGTLKETDEDVFEALLEAPNELIEPTLDVLLGLIPVLLELLVDTVLIEPLLEDAPRELLEVPAGVLLEIKLDSKTESSGELVLIGVLEATALRLVVPGAVVLLELALLEEALLKEAVREILEIPLDDRAGRSDEVPIAVVEDSILVNVLLDETVLFVAIPLKELVGELLEVLLDRRSGRSEEVVLIA